MSYSYEYTRNKLAKGYDLEITITDEGGDVYTIQPNKDITVLFPTAEFKVFCEDTKLICVFEVELTTGEEAQLDTYISSYRT